MKKIDAQPMNRFSPTRRHFLGAVVAVGAAGALPVSALAQAQAAALNPNIAQAIADHFSSIKTMKGGFLQIGPRGDQMSGSFFIQRPGKMRFNYDPPSRMRVICDGNNVQVINDQTNTKNMYQLSKTPLRLSTKTRKINSIFTSWTFGYPDSTASGCAAGFDHAVEQHR